MEKTKIIDFIKNQKKIFIPLGIIILLILIILASLGATALSNTRDGSYAQTVQNSFGGRMELSADMDDMVEESMMKSISVEPGLPYPDERTAEYDESVERKIIKNGDLSLVVRNMEESKKQIEQITEKYDGFIQHKSFSEDEYGNVYNNRGVVSKSGYYELKIPTENFSTAYEDFKSIALKIISDSVSGRDVTEEYADLETRIANKKAEEEQYRQILKKAYKVEDVLKVTKYINNTRLEIERLEGRKNYLANQISLSTIRINLTAEKDVEIFGVVWSPLLEIKAGFKSFLQDMTNFADSVIAFVFKLPAYLLYLLVWVVGLVILWKILTKLKKRFWKKASNEINH